MRSIDLTDTTGGHDGRNKAEKILVLLTSGSREDWGEFEPLRGTSWEAGVEFISGDSLSHALHGYFMPFLRELGRDPRASAKRVTKEEGECKSQSFCPTWDPALCRPGGKGGPPGCYEVPLSEGTDPALIDLFNEVAMAWKEGRHTIVVTGSGFNIA